MAEFGKESNSVKDGSRGAGGSGGGIGSVIKKWRDGIMSTGQSRPLPGSLTTVAATKPQNNGSGDSGGDVSSSSSSSGSSSSSSIRNGSPSATSTPFVRTKQSRQATGLDALLNPQNRLPGLTSANANNKGRSQGQISQKESLVQTESHAKYANELVRSPVPEGSDPRSSFERKQQPYRLSQFDSLLQAENIDLNALRKLSWNGVPPEFRPMVWQLLLGYMPTNKSRREASISRKRKEYVDSIPQYFDIPDEDRGTTELALKHQVCNAERCEICRCFIIVSFSFSFSFSFYLSLIYAYSTPFSPTRSLWTFQGLPRTSHSFNKPLSKKLSKEYCTSGPLVIPRVATFR